MFLKQNLNAGAKKLRNLGIMYFSVVEKKKKCEIVLCIFALLLLGLHQDKLGVAKTRLSRWHTILQQRLFGVKL